MTVTVSLPRLTLALAVTAMLLGGTGCSWFRKGSKLYTADASSRPLEVPPDLDMPRGNGAAAGSAMASATQSSAPSTGPAPQASNSGFVVSGTREAAFEQVGKALDGIDGVTVASRAQLLGVFDVNFGGTNFLVRVASVESGAYVSAVDPRGQPMTSDAATRLVAALKAALVGN